MSIMNEAAREVPAEERTTGRAVVGNVWLHRAGQFITYGILTAMAIAALMPIYWMFTTSLKGQASYLKQPPELIPADPTLENFQQMFANPNMANWIFNSFFISISVTLLNIFFASLAGYVFAKLDFPGRRWMFWAYLATMMVPFQVTMFPLFKLMVEWGWVNTYLALIVPAACWPYNVFLMRQVIQSLPSEILDAGRIDGCNEFSLFWQVVLPMSTNGIAVMGIFTFIASWNDFLWPLIILNSEKMRTLPIALATFQSTYETNYGLLMAGGVIMAVPMFIMFFVFQRYFLQGVTFGALKG
jgi:multiple sugar transport system permease protein